MANEYNPDSVSPPSETLRDLMKERGFTVEMLAEKMIAPRSLAEELVNGDIRIDFLTAGALAEVFGTPAEFWMNRQQAYDESLKRKAG